MIDLIPSKKRQDKFVIALLDHRNGKPNPAFDDEPMVVYYDKSDKDINNNKKSHRYGTKIVYEGKRDMATVCWEERAISPDGIPVYIETVIVVKPSGIIPQVKDFIDSTEKTNLDGDNVYSEEDIDLASMRYINLLSSYGMLKLDDDEIDDAIMYDKKAGNFEVMQEYIEPSQMTIPVSEFTQTWVDCWTDTKWNGVVWSCESPKISYNTHVWVLIASSIFLLGLIVYVIIAMLYHRHGHEYHIHT